MNLALKFRPQKLSELLGQDELVQTFQKFIELQKLPHSIFFGPSGSGKTSFARIVAKEFSLDFFVFDAASFKMEELRNIVQRYKQSLYKPLIFIDEIHRLSRTQQDLLLLPMESLNCILIGASTENPYFVLSSGIRSRSMLFEFQALQDKDLEALLLRLAKELDIKIEDEAKKLAIRLSAGDVRALLNLVEFALVFDNKNLKTENINKVKAKTSQNLNNKDSHYDLISAFIKSLRGSDVDAALYYLARMIEAHENADFIARRMLIFASEDIGNADTNALTVATNTLLAVKNIGYPEARIILAQCCVYLASAVKSNSSYKAINKALDYVKNNKALEIPNYLKNKHEDKKNYLYPHDFGGFVRQRYLSKDVKFYESTQKGDEKRLFEIVKNYKDKA